MKKKLLKLLGMLVILCMLFAAVGCASTSADDDDEDTRKEDDNNKNNDEDEDAGIVGTWEAEMDLSSAMNAAINEVAGIETDFEDLTIGVELKIKKNNTYTMAADKDSVQDMLDEFLDQFKDVMKDMIEEAADEYEMTFDEFIEQAGYDSFDDFFEDAAAEMDGEDMVEEFDIDEEGAWKLKGNKLWLGDGDDIDEDTYYVIELKGKTMTWEEATGTEEEMSEYLLPLTFKKK